MLVKGANLVRSPKYPYPRNSRIGDLSLSWKLGLKLTSTLSMLFSKLYIVYPSQSYNDHKTTLTKILIKACLLSAK